MSVSCWIIIFRNYLLIITLSFDTAPPEYDISSDESYEHPIVRILIDDLLSGVEYTFEIQTVSYDLISDTTVQSLRTMPLIQSEVLIVNNLHERDTLTLSYTPTPQGISKFDSYLFSLGDLSITDKEKLANDNERKVTFTGLTPGRLYNITVWTVSANVRSQPIQRRDRMYPDPITQLNATVVTDTEITLKWDIPKGEYNAFEVQYLRNDEHLVKNVTLHNTITIVDLKPHRNYTFTVVVRSGTESSVLRDSLPVSAIFQTQESVPGRVDVFEPNDVQPSQITFEWSLSSSEANGVIKEYVISYHQDGSSETHSKEFPPTQHEGTISHLLPGKAYIFKIQAKTAVGPGPETVHREKMPILPPPKPDSHIVPIQVLRTSTTIQIRFRKNYFSEKNGPVINYTIIVAEDISKNASGLEMLSWQDVQSYSVWPPYQVHEPYNPFLNSSVENFTIGIDTDCEHKIGFCNGPLKPGTSYGVKVRAFTDKYKFTDTAYSAIQTGELSFCDFPCCLIPLK